LNKQNLRQKIENPSSKYVISISCADNEPILVTSLSNGTLNVYDYAQNVFLLKKTISLETLHLEYTSRHSTEKNEINLLQNDTSMLCIGIQIFSIGTNNSLNVDSGGEKTFVQTIIVCSTSNAIYFIDANGGNILNLIDFKSIQLNTKHLNISCLIPQCVDFCIIENKQINAALMFLFQNELDILKCADITPAIKSTPVVIAQDSSVLSVFPK